MDGAALPESIRPALRDTEAAIAVKAWNLMGGEIQWSALEFIAELFGIQDMDIFIHQLAAIRDHGREQ